MSKTAKATYTFTLVLTGAADLTDELTDALFEAGCDDALPGMREGVVYLDFTREASSLGEAILSAIADVEGANAGARVARVEPDELVTMSEIARRAQRSRENIRQLATGRRGPGDFPPPVANLTKRSPIWRWTDVARWLAEKEGTATPLMKEASPGTAEAGSVIAALNATLEVRRHVRTTAEAMELYKRLLEPRQPGGRPTKRQHQDTT